MKIKIKRIWVEALRSGKFKQSKTDCLRSCRRDQNNKVVGLGYCPLGTLAGVVMRYRDFPGQWRPTPYNDCVYQAFFSEHMDPTDYRDGVNYLPKFFLEKFGISHELERELCMWHGQETFIQIAERLEQGSTRMVLPHQC